MRIFLILILFFSIKLSYAQKKECGCQKDSLINKNTTDCKTTYLKNGAKLYWQFNCKTIWLTLENKSGKRIKIHDVPIEYYPYTYRLGYSLCKEYKKLMLFRYGCPANGPCMFALINKNSGKKIKELPELIYNHTTDIFYDFIIYFSSPNSLILYFAETGRGYKIPINRKYFNALIPEYQFDDIVLKNNIVTLTYNSNKLDTIGKIVIDLKKYKH